MIGILARRNGLAGVTSKMVYIALSDITMIEPRPHEFRCASGTVECGCSGQCVVTLSTGIELLAEYEAEALANTVCSCYELTEDNVGPFVVGDVGFDA